MDATLPLAGGWESDLAAEPRAVLELRASPLRHVPVDGASPI